MLTVQGAAVGLIGVPQMHAVDGGGSQTATWGGGQKTFGFAGCVSSMGQFPFDVGRSIGGGGDAMNVSFSRVSDRASSAVS